MEKRDSTIMRKQYWITSSLVLPFFMILLACPGPAMAQYEVLHGTFSNGGSSAAGDFIAWSSAGQIAVGISTGDHMVKSGFWYLAEISSTVDVAIVSFSGSSVGEYVVLSWSVKSDLPLLGFNVYRSRRSDSDHLRLNDELLPAGALCSYSDYTVLPGESYFYCFGWVGLDGEHLSHEVNVVTPELPLTLFQNFPNPFNPSTSVRYYLPDEASVSLDIFDVSGKHVACLVSEVQEKGYHTATWRGTDSRGDMATSGIYFCLLKAGKERLSKKIVMLK